jgi:hypothetical protein
VQVSEETCGRRPAHAHDDKDVTAPAQLPRSGLFRPRRPALAAANSPKDTAATSISNHHVPICAQDP